MPAVLLRAGRLLWTATYRMEHGKLEPGERDTPTTGFKMTGRHSCWEDPGGPLVGRLSAWGNRPKSVPMIGWDRRPGERHVGLLHCHPALSALSTDSTLWRSAVAGEPPRPPSVCAKPPVCRKSFEGHAWQGEWHSLANWAVNSEPHSLLGGLRCWPALVSFHRTEPAIWSPNGFGSCGGEDRERLFALLSQKMNGKRSEQGA